MILTATTSGHVSALLSSVGTPVRSMRGDVVNSAHVLILCASVTVRKSLDIYVVAAILVMAVFNLEKDALVCFSHKTSSSYTNYRY